MTFAPSKVYSDNTKSNRIYTEMWTGRWWHVQQVYPSILFNLRSLHSNCLQSHVNNIKPGATIVPVVIATDKTQLTQFSGNKAAYPVYLTIGNIPKSLRRKPSAHTTILIAYLSVDKIDRKRMSDQEQRSRTQRVFHESMRLVLEPLIDAGKKGVEMVSSDGAVRDVFPLLTCYVADYPEQCLVTCTKYGTCPKCQSQADQLQEVTAAEPRDQKWTTAIIENAKVKADGNHKIFHDTCMSSQVAGSVYKPFWYDFPLCDIHKSITPDVLHQLYQGVFKHLVRWCQNALGPVKLDEKIRCLPPAFGLRHFKNGFSALSQISGPERKQMAKILLGCLIGSMPKSGIQAVSALLDFIYIAQYSAHDNTTLGYLQDALDRFHHHRHYFLQIGVRQNFNIPKFHSLLHYIDSIKAFGTTDNYNTEMFERLHIDFAKHGWRASNHRDEFPQMINWLSRQEKIDGFAKYLLEISRPGEDLIKGSTNSAASLKNDGIYLAKYPHHPNRPISYLLTKYRAPDFAHHLKLYLSKFQTNSASLRLLNQYSLPFTKVDVYDMFRFRLDSLQDEMEEKDMVKAVPPSKQLPDGRFDPVVIMVSDEAESTGLAGQ